MRPAMYSFINRSLGMTPGKMTAQGQHAAVEAFRISDPALLDAWYLGGHYCKLVMLAEDDIHLLTIQKYIEERGFKTKLIIDEGHTEVRPLSMTALGVEIVDRDDPHTAATFETFKLYKEDQAVFSEAVENEVQRRLEAIKLYPSPYAGRCKDHRPKPDKMVKRPWWRNW